MPEHVEAPRPAAEPQNWYTHDLQRPLVATSYATAGRSEHRADRTEMAGHMDERFAQPSQPDLDVELQPAEAIRHIDRFVSHHLGLEPGATAVLFPQHDYGQPLVVTDVDAVLPPDPARTSATRLAERSDFLFTYDLEKVLACTPADCPVLVGKGIDGDGRQLLFLEHLGWQSLNAGYLGEGLAFLASKKVDAGSLRLYIAPSARPQSFHYTNADNPLTDANPRFTHPSRDQLFVNVHQTTLKDGRPGYGWDIDTIGFIRQRLAEAGVKDWQIFVDDTDTASNQAGHASNTRAFNNQELEGRDIVVATRKPGAGTISYPSSKAA